MHIHQCNKCTILLGDVGKRGSDACVGAESREEMLPLRSAVSLTHTHTHKKPPKNWEL